MELSVQPALPVPAAVADAGGAPFERYYATLAFSRSRAYLTHTRVFLERYRDYLAGRPPDKDTALVFLQRFRERAAGTRATYVAYLSAFFTFLGDGPLPLHLKPPRTLPPLVTREDLERLVATMEARATHKATIERDTLLVATAAATGLRRSELARLAVGDLYLGERPPFLRVVGGKGGRDRSVPLAPDVAARLGKFTWGRPAAATVFGLTPGQVSGIVKSWAERAGLPHLHVHSLRHYVATTLLRRGVNPGAVQRLLGHEQLATTMRYCHVSGDDLADAVAALGATPGGEDPAVRRRRRAVDRDAVAVPAGPALTVAALARHGHEIAKAAGQLAANLKLFRRYGIVHEQPIGRVTLVAGHRSRFVALAPALADLLLELAGAVFVRLRGLRSWGELRVEEISDDLVGWVEGLAAGVVPGGWGGREGVVGRYRVGSEYLRTEQKAGEAAISEAGQRGGDGEQNRGAQGNYSPNCPTYKTMLTKRSEPGTPSLTASSSWISLMWRGASFMDRFPLLYTPDTAVST